MSRPITPTPGTSPWIGRTLPGRALIARRCTRPPMAWRGPMAWSNVAAGTSTLTARAIDSAGATTPSTAVTVIADAPPTVSLTAPSAGASFAAPAAIALAATASDSDGSVTRVDFYAGATL